MGTQSAKSRRKAFILVAMIVVLGSLLATAYALWRLRVETIDRQLDRAALTARALEDHLTQSFNVIDRTLVNVAEDHEDTTELVRALRQAPYLRSTAIVNEQMRITASSNSSNLGVRLERNDFLPLTAEPVEILRVGALREGRDFSDGQPHLPDSPNPTLSFLPLSRDVRLPDGHWLTVIAAVNTDFFLNFYSNHLSPIDGVVQLLRYDGRLLLSTDETEMPGSLTHSAGVLKRIAETDVAQFEELQANGQVMLTAYRSSRSYPFVLVVRLDKEQALADWRQEARSTSITVTAVLLAALAFASLYFLRFERVAREQARDQERLRIAAIAFESQEGIVVTSASAVILQVNKAFTEITGYTAAESIGRDMNFLKSGQHKPAFYAAIRRSVERTGGFAGEILNRNKDGSIHPHFLIITAVRNADDVVSHFVGTITDITERKRTEESLLTLSRAIEQSPACIMITDPDSNIQYVNPVFETTTGYPLAEVIGKNPRLLNSGEKSSTEYREMWSTLISGKTWQGEFHNRRKDGSLFWELASISPVYNDQRVLLHYVAVKENITARKLADEKISELNRDFVAFLENTSDFIYFKDRSSRFRFCSQTMANITGHASWRDLTGKHDREVFPADNAKIYSAEESPIFQEGKPLLNKIDPYYDAAGKLGWVSTSKWPLFDECGAVVGLFGISHDITEQKQDEEKLHLAASVFSHSREGIMITATNGAIIDVNDAFTRITGYARQEVLGENPRILSSGRHGKDYYATMWRGLTEKGHWYGEVWNRRKNGEVYAEMQTISTVRDAKGNAKQYVSLFSDITATKTHEKQLEHIAHYDALTSLPNRVLLADRLHQAMAQAERRGQKLAVAYLDLDGFKAINDNHGHEAGDQLLISVATRMKQALREGDTLARLGGDEFVAVLLDLENVEASVPLLIRLLSAAAKPVHVGNLVLQVSASVGVTFYPQLDAVDADQLLRQADQAMYQAKIAGKNRYHVFDAEQDRSIRGHHESLEHIRSALYREEFVLYYQPKVNMRTGAVIGAEALIRWQHPERGLLPPSAFLPTIEDTPLAVEVGEWVIASALSQMATWQAAGLAIPVSVNVCARQIQQTDFIERLRAALLAYPTVKSGSLELEVLETSALEDLTHVAKVIEVCKEIGVMFALDDFGTGYSSLTYLKRLSVNQLKIDRSFVHNMLVDPDDLAILDGVIGLATALRHQVIAEGVETVEHGEILLQLGCELAQGFCIGYPMPADEFPVWASNWRPDPAWLNRPAVSRNDLPLLFAGVEHCAWVAAVEKHLKDKRTAPPALDVHHCRFGVWLDSGGLQQHNHLPGFQVVERLHHQAHHLAKELCDLLARGRREEALARLDALYVLRDHLFKQLKALLHEKY